jgi:molybdate transport system substrate-binding protein
MRRHALMLRLCRRSTTHAWLLAVMCLAVAGCERAEPAPLRIAAASDLQLALPKLVDRFRASTGTEASLAFGASGQLAEQIKQGAPFDVFLSANESFVRDLADGGLIKPGSVHRYARGSLVVAVNRAMESKIQSLADLKRPEVKKIALANPAIAPYGRAGKQALQGAGVWDELQSKIVIAESVRQALLYAQKGDVEAALVGRAIVNVPEIVPVEVDSHLYDPIIQALGIVGASGRGAEAEKFVRFVIDREGQAVLKDFGFTHIESDRPAADHDGKRN